MRGRVVSGGRRHLSSALPALFAATEPAHRDGGRPDYG